MDTGAFSNNRRLERHSKHAARHPSPDHDFTQARPAHLNARDEALDAIIRNVEDSDAADHQDLQPRLFGHHSGGFFGPGDSGSGSGNDDGNGNDNGNGGGNGFGNGNGHSSSTPSHTISKCTYRGTDGQCTDAPPETSTTSRFTPSSTSTTSITPTSTSTSSSSTRSTSTTSSSSTRTTSSSTPTTSSTSTSSSSSTLLITTNGTTRTSVAFVTASNIAPAASSTPSSSDDGPGAGPIVGIVAGSLAGVAVLSAIIGFIWKKYSAKKAEDAYEGNPFGGGNDRDDFRRGSAMLPDDAYDEDEFNAPSMSEHGYANGPMSNGHGSYGAEMAGAAGMGALAAGGAAMMARNESGAPRPPTMFARHLAQVNNTAAAPPMPNAGEMYQGNEGMYEDAYPQLPPMAFGPGGAPDPYSMNQNVSNPYAHLDRAQGQAAAAEGYYSNLDRSGSQGSQQSGSSSHHPQAIRPGQGGGAGQFAHQDSFASAQEQEEGRDFDTSGRPATSEGRSGTPDLPNMQQTYVMNGGIDGSSVGHNNVGRESVLGSSAAEAPLRNPHGESSADPFNDSSPINSEKANVTHKLSVRNLLPNPHEAQSQQGGNRPLSTVSSVADPDDIYGGIY